MTARMGGALACALGLSLLAQRALAQTDPGIEDLEGIEAALYRYTRGLDRLDADLYLSALTPDAVLSIVGDERSGQDAFREIIAGEAALRETEPRTLYHLELNPAYAMTGPDSATHTAYWLTVSQTEAGLEVFDAGSLTDDLRKIDGEWLIARREIVRAP